MAGLLTPPTPVATTRDTAGALIGMRRTLARNSPGGSGTVVAFRIIGLGLAVATLLCGLIQFEEPSRSVDLVAALMLGSASSRLIPSRRKRARIWSTGPPDRIASTTSDGRSASFRVDPPQGAVEVDAGEDGAKRSLTPVLHPGGDQDGAERQRHEHVPLPPHGVPGSRERHRDHRLGLRMNATRTARGSGRRRRR
jgi:hypothetical protein